MLQSNISASNNSTSADGISNSVVLGNDERLTVQEEITADVGQPAVDIVGDRARLSVVESGSLSAPDAGNSAVLASGNDSTVLNTGLISGALNGVSSTGDRFTLVNDGTLASDSRAVDITDGNGVSFINNGEVIGTGNQWNGTAYVDGTVDDLRIRNGSEGVIDAGKGNLGDAISVQVGASDDLSSDDINISNSGLLQGRGDGPAVFADGGRVGGNGSSGLRFFNGTGQAEARLSGSIRNSGTITSEVNVGFLGGLVVEDGVAFNGRVANTADGLISGPRNGLYIGNADHDLTISNAGRIESGSRAVNIDGDGVSLRNSGEIVGTGNQRNGAVYVDGTADDYSITNTSQGVIDAGEGNLGDAIAIQVGAAGDPSSEDININNSGLLQGRGDGAEVFANGARVAGNGSSGLRFFNGSGLAEAALSGSIRNSGTITSEVNVGFLGGLVVEDGVAFEGRIANTSSGVISGPRNGLYIGNADHDLDIVNAGRIESGSRAVNIDGTGVRLRNSGTIIGTGDQRNGTVYADGTADDYSITNTRSGVIDAGEGNDGAGVSLQLGDVANDVVTASIRNDGLIRGRGQAAAGTNAAGDGVRLFTSVAEGGVTFDGNIGNTGRIIGSQDGISIQSGVTLAGRINNRGTIQGRVNAINAQDAAGGVTVDNRGKIQGDVVLSEFGDVFTSSSSSFVNGTISGLGGDDLLEGGRTADTLIGGSGNDRLRGGLGQDSFVFESAGFGDDVIFDFQRGQDLLDVSGLSLGASDVKSIIGNAQQVGNAAQLSFGGGSVTLQGVQASALETSDFTFTA